MKFQHHEVVDSNTINTLASNIWNKRVTRQGTLSINGSIDFQPEEVKVYVDGPLTFAILNVSGDHFTGWSKCNAIDYPNKLRGIAIALQRAVDSATGVR